MKNFRNNGRDRTSKLPLLVLVAALAASFAALAQVGPTIPKPTAQTVPQDSSSKEKLTDRSFVEKAAQGGIAEVEISKLAIQKTANKKLKNFATTMVKDHELANIKLKQIALANRLTIPAGISSEQQKMLAELQGLTGEEFDRTYIDIMKKDHDTTVALFDNAAGEATLSPDLRVFANQTLPTLRGHQKHAHALAGIKS